MQGVLDTTLCDKVDNIESDVKHHNPNPIPVQ
jgi:hypothetical protein